jgi:hypothetical protein
VESIRVDEVALSPTLYRHRRIPFQKWHLLLEVALIIGSCLVNTPFELQTLSKHTRIDYYYDAYH